MADTTPTRAAIAQLVRSLHGIGFRLDHVIDRPNGWRLYQLRHPGQPRGLTFGPYLPVPAPPKQHAEAVAR